MDKHNLGEGCEACAASHPCWEDQLSLCLTKPWLAGAVGMVLAWPQEGGLATLHSLVDTKGPYCGRTSYKTRGDRNFESE